MMILNIYSLLRVNSDSLFHIAQCSYQSVYMLCMICQSVQSVKKALHNSECVHAQCANCLKPDTNHITDSDFNSQLALFMASVYHYSCRLCTSKDKTNIMKVKTVSPLHRHLDWQMLH